MTKRVKWAIAFTLVTLLLASCGGQSTAEKPADPGGGLEKEDPLEAVIGEYNKAIRLDPTDADAYYNRGVIYGDLGQHQRAIQDYSEAIALIQRMPKPTTTGA